MHLLFQASAGSGKTYKLSLFYLKLLKKLYSQNSEALRQIFATTFTNKAVYEMKERIISFLKEIILQTEKGKSIAEETALSPEEAEKCLEEIFLNYDYLEIKTIDSFLLKLFRGLAYELNLPPNFRIKSILETSLLEKALLALFDRATQEEEVWTFLGRFVDFLISEEDSLSLNFKAKLLRELNKVIELSTYKEEFIFFKKNELSPSGESSSFQRGFFYFKLWSLLKEELEKILIDTGDLYLGIWKEKLASQITENFFPWIYLKLGNLQAFIIDEFQDTDKLQWIALSPIIEDLISQGKFFIIAGDSKQCLYRWKGADPSLMKSVKETLEPYGLYLSPLSHNFRSCENIVSFNNLFFSLLKEDGELKKKILERVVFGKTVKEREEDLLEYAMKEFDGLFSHITQSSIKNLNGSIFVEFIDFTNFPKKLSSKDRQKFIYERIEKILRELQEENLLEDTAILLRENEDISELSSYLISCGFEVVGSSLLKLKESPLLNTLLAYIKLLIDPKDEISITTVLLGILKDKGREILSHFQKFKHYSNKSFTLSQYLQVYEDELWKTYFENPLTKGNFLNLYQYLRYVVNTFSLENLFPDEKPYLYKFLSFILHEISKETDLWSIVRNWETYSEKEGLNLPEEKESIQILTIHLSKGLEFQNVIIPLNFTLRPYRPPLFSLFTKEGIYRGKKEDLPPHIRKLYYTERIQKDLEIFNLLYVAFTRAIKNLYILVPKGTNYLASEIFLQVYERLKERYLQNGSFVIERT
ncbi:MAG: UvrD-helicase domain-containing protein [Caldimicrobium sp.]